MLEKNAQREPLMVVLVGALIVVFLKSKMIILSFQADVRLLSVETSRLLNRINEYINSDLHPLTGETKHLVSKINAFSAKLSNNNSEPLNILFKVLGFTKPQQTYDSGNNGSNVQTDLIPQVIKWVASGALLYKMVRGMVKK